MFASNQSAIVRQKFNKMNKTAPVIALLVANLGFASSSAWANQYSDEVMKICKEARDFLGCAKAFSEEPASSKQETTTNPEQCNEEGWCKANAGTDVFGLPKVVGWEYKSYDNGLHYVSPKYYKIKHKGRSNRYLARKYVWHYYQEATPATSGYYKTVSSGKRKCGYHSNGSYYCYTTAPKRVWVPGKPGRPGGSRVTHYTWVNDCEDKTYAYYYSGKLRGKWKKGRTVDECKQIDEFSILNLKL